MNSGGTPAEMATPSTRRLFAATGAALGVAVLALVVAILPAEYGIDPLGTGRAMGLVPPALPGAGTMPSAAAAGSALVPTPVGPADYYASPFATDMATFELGPYDYVEYKYRLEPGARMTFAWRATADVIHDFHAEPDGTEEHTEVSFDKRTIREAFGVHRAPMPGLHGWMWENPGSEPITVTLSTAGFYSSAIELRPNRRRIPHEIRPALEPGAPKD
jgi:hypothetical protein